MVQHTYKRPSWTVLRTCLSLLQLHPLHHSMDGASVHAARWHSA